VVALGFTLATALAKDTMPSATIKLSGGIRRRGRRRRLGQGHPDVPRQGVPDLREGVSVGDVGVTSIEASGKVFDLKTSAIFDGNYTTVDAGVTAAGGAGVAVMKNQNGVTVELLSTTQGVQIGLGGAGVDMKINK